MRTWDEVFPEYGLASHQGYATPEHTKAIEEFGLTPLHRLSFEPVRARSRFPLDRRMDLFGAAAGRFEAAAQ
jgi:ribonuclease HII